jgi:HEAT repeat protein
MLWLDLWHLKSADADVRAKAVQRLGSGKQNKAVPPLLKLLEDESPQVRIAVMDALGAIGHPASVEPLVSALSNQHKIAKSRSQRSSHETETMEHEALTKALAAIGQPAVAPLLKALESEDKEGRRLAVQVLGWIKDPRAVEPLMRKLEDNRSDVRQAAALALGTIGDPRAVGALVKAADGRDMETRRAAAEALGLLGSEDAVDTLIKAVGDQSESVQLAAIKALAQIGGLRAAACLRSAMTGSRKTIGDAAEAALKSMQFSPASAGERAELAVILNDFASARGEGNMAVPAFIKALGFKDPQMRAKAAESLGLFKSAETVAPLLQALKDTSPVVQEAAVNALVNIGIPALEGLESFLTFYDASVVRSAAIALGRIGSPGCAPALADLIIRNSAISNEYPEMLDAVKAAADALGGILMKSPGTISQQNLNLIAELPEAVSLIGSQPLKTVDCSGLRSRAKEELLRRDAGNPQPKLQ